MSFSNKVGIKFLEVMSGRVGANGLEGDTGEFSFDLQIVIPSLRKFLDADLHEAQIAGGHITWSPFLPGRVPVKPGRLILYRAEDHTKKRKYFDFDFSFDSGSGFDIRAEGHKHLINNTEFDAASDLSTVFLMLHGPNAPIARGVVSVHINDLLRQLRSMQVTDATAKTKKRRRWPLSSRS